MPPRFGRFATRMARGKDTPGAIDRSLPVDVPLHRVHPLRLEHPLGVVEDVVDAHLDQGRMPAPGTSPDCQGLPPARHVDPRTPHPTPTRPTASLNAKLAEAIQRFDTACSE